MRVSLVMVGAALLVMTPPSLAQEAAQAAPVADEAGATQPAPDPERLAVASRLIDRIWPLGTYRRIMESTMGSADRMAEATIDTLDLMTATDDKESRRARHEARTGRPLPRAADEQAVAANIEASMAALNASMLSTFERIEPSVREALSRVYARRYSLDELNELDAFFATPTGSRYAGDSLTLMNDPEIVAVMGRVVEESMSSAAPHIADAADAAAAAAAADAAAAATAVSAAAKY